MSWGFQAGRVYNRRKDIHDRFAGQEQGGIITPAKHNLVIIVTGEAGGAHGYGDRRRPDGVFEYFGEGQKGDMRFIKGNRAIFEHAQNGKDLLMFAQVKGGYRFEGQYVCEGFHVERAPDTEHNERDAIVFELRPLEAVQEIEAVVDPVPADDLAQLRAMADRAVKQDPQSRERIATVFERSKVIRSYVLKRSKGKCEDCAEGAPFVTKAGLPFLEVHHIRRMTDGGPDDFRHMIALCPNCHRRAHFGADAADCNARMAGFVRILENA